MLIGMKKDSIFADAVFWVDVLYCVIYGPAFPESFLTLKSKVLTMFLCVAKTQARYTAAATSDAIAIDILGM